MIRRPLEVDWISGRNLRACGALSADRGSERVFVARTRRGCVNIARGNCETQGIPNVAAIVWGYE